LLTIFISFFLAPSQGFASSWNEIQTKQRMLFDCMLKGAEVSGVASQELIGNDATLRDPNVLKLLNLCKTLEQTLEKVFVVGSDGRTVNKREFDCVHNTADNKPVKARCTARIFQKVDPEKSLTYDEFLTKLFKGAKDLSSEQELTERSAQKINESEVSAELSSKLFAEYAGLPITKTTDLYGAVGLPSLGNKTDPNQTNKCLANISEGEGVVALGYLVKQYGSWANKYQRVSNQQNNIENNKRYFLRNCDLIVGYASDIYNFYKESGDSSGAQLLPIYQRVELLNSWALKAGYSSAQEYEFIKSLGISLKEFRSLAQYDISNGESYKQAILELEEADFPNNSHADILKFLNDRKKAKDTGATIAAVRADRKRAEKIALQELEERKRKKREAREAKKMAQKKAIAALAIKQVKLGVPTDKCKAREATYVDVMQKPVRLQYQCKFGSTSDQVKVVFAADGKTVVSVSRSQYLKPSDPTQEEIVKAAIEYYGPPAHRDDDNWTAIYGNAHRHSYSGKRISIKDKKSGMGMLIKGRMCGNGRYGTANCRVNGVTQGTGLIEYNLVDQAALAASIRAGKARMTEKNKSKVKKQTF
jgi:hypothetical protein